MNCDTSKELTVVPVNHHSSANYHGGRPCAEIRDGDVRIAIVSSVEETQEATNRNAHLMKAASVLYAALESMIDVEAAVDLLVEARDLDREAIGRHRRAKKIRVAKYLHEQGKVPA